MLLFRTGGAPTTHHRIRANNSSSSSSSSSSKAAAAAAAPSRAFASPRPVRRRSVMAPPLNAASARQPEPPLTDDVIRLAHDLADAAGRVTTRYFRTGVLADTKSDASPVTVADRQAEEAMRALLGARAPTHAVFGEEFGLSAPPAAGSGTSPFPGNSTSGAGASNAEEGKLGDVPEWLWVLDPIDGTKSFVTGKPVFGTLVALLHRGAPVLGVIDQPVTRERWVGATGRPTTLNGRPVTTRACPAVREAYAYATTPHMFAAGETERAWGRVRDACRIPLYGCDCYAYGLLAAGHVDLVVEADLKPYDYLALVPVVEGAGGMITDWRGERLRWTGTGGGGGEVVAAGDARVHAEALTLLGWKGGEGGLK